MKYIRQAALFIMLLSLSGCGVYYTYLNNEEKSERPLSMVMTRADVEETLGEPKRVIRDNGHVQVLEYRLYSRYHWMKEVLACPFTAWLGGCLIYPSIGASDPDYPEPFYVVLHEGHLCVWGPLEAITASDTCQPPRKPFESKS